MASGIISLAISADCGSKPQRALVAAQRGCEFVAKFHRPAGGEKNQRLFFIAFGFVERAAWGAKGTGGIFQHQRTRRYGGLLGLHAAAACIPIEIEPAEVRSYKRRAAIAKNLAKRTARRRCNP